MTRFKKHHFIDKQANKPEKVRVLENAIHKQIAQYLNTVIKRPSRWWTIEVSNQAKGKAAMLRQMSLKAKGVATGTPDIIIMWRGKFVWTRLIFLEVKAPGGKLTEKQEALHQELREDGHRVEIVYSVDDVRRVLTDLGVI